MLDVLLKLVGKDFPAVDTLEALGSAELQERYLAATVRNAVLTRFRRRAVEHRASGHLQDLARARQDSAAATAPADSALLASEAVTRLLRRVGDLSAQDQELLRLRFWENLTIRTIAKELGVSYTAAAVRLFRLLQKLRAESRGADPTRSD